jgi:tRNA threonylcarbamoyl adenosine modification protein (Sua5/YciO/YrdC/YwlC family)
MLHIVFHPVNPNIRDIKQVAEKINSGAIVIFPTDTLYAMGCLMTNKAGIEKICRVLNKKEKHTKMSLICPNISEVSKYTMQIDNNVFKAMKKYLPGPYTFVLKSNKYVQKYFKNAREEIGIRIPDNEILKSLQEHLDAPLISTSLNTDGEKNEIYNDPDDILEVFRSQADILIDGGLGSLGESTVLDCTDHEMSVIREGIGPLD